MSVLEITDFNLVVDPPEKRPAADYEGDFQNWAFKQAALIRAGDFAHLDVENLVEELDSLARSQGRELRNRYIVLLTHLLKWQYQPKRRTKSWRVTIGNQRSAIEDVVKDSPSLKATEQDKFASAYRAARYEASKQALIAIERFPTEPPFTLDQARDPDFWPEAAGNEGRVG